MTETVEPKTRAVFDFARNKKLIDELKKAGDGVVSIPAADVSKIETAAFSVPLAEIDGFDWIVFADVYAADFFLELLSENDFDAFELDDLHVCALGESVADRLRFAQIHTDVIPARNAADEIVESLENYIYGENRLAGKKILLLKEAGERLDFAAALEKKNAEVTEAAIYRAAYASPNDLPKIKALVKGGAIDEMIFTAPEDFLQCRFLFRRENVAEILRDAKIFAADEATRRALGENQISAALFSLADAAKKRRR